MTFDCECPNRPVIQRWILSLSLVFIPAILLAQADPCALTWYRVNSPNSPGQFVGQAVAYDSQRQVAVLFGGENPLTGVHSTSATWEWNGASWIQRTSGSPPARKDAAMAYDSGRGVCVLFGGGTNVFQHEIPFNDTWEWDGSIWTLRKANDPAATDRPPPVDNPVLVYDSVRRRTVLAGAYERAGAEINPLSKTWEWDGNNWVAHAAVPPARSGTAMAYDPVRGFTVLFGGTPPADSHNNETWTWNGTIWTRVATGGPPPRDEHALAFDPRRKVLVLFGGLGTSIEDVYQDTWEWDGSGWSLRPFAYRFGLIGRRRHKMWYDTGDQKAVVFGGTWSRRNGDGSYSHFILDDLWEARPPGLWVDFNYVGTRTGDFYTPYNTMAEAVSAAPVGCTLNLKAGSRAETLTISKQLTLEAYNGPATVGQ
jgi:hypothetical protein